jgi:hypothetical protein
MLLLITMDVLIEHNLMFYKCNFIIFLLNLNLLLTLFVFDDEITNKQQYLDIIKPIQRGLIEDLDSIEIL